RHRRRDHGVPAERRARPDRAARRSEHGGGRRVSVQTTMAPPTAPPRLKRRRARFRLTAGPIRGLLPLIVLLVVWQLVGSTSSISFPPPETWITAIRDLAESGILWPASRTTLITFA